MHDDAANALAILPLPAEVQRELGTVLRVASLLRRQLRLSARAEEERRKAAGAPARDHRGLPCDQQQDPPGGEGYGG
jgi:hypothetical protein